MPDACTLVTLAEAEAFLGQPAKADSTSGSACNYVNADGIGVVGITVRKLRPGDEDLILHPSGGAHTVSGLGDAASETINSQGGGAIQVAKSGLVLDVSVRQEDPNKHGQVVPIDPGAFEALAKTIVSRV